MSQNFNPVGWFELYVDDMARAKKFYEAVFQRPLADLPASQSGDTQMALFTMDMSVPGCAGALVKSPRNKPGPGGTMIYFTCLDCAVEAARAAAAGGTVCQPRVSIGEYGFIAIVQDTEGNTIGLHSRQ